MQAIYLAVLNLTKYTLLNNTQFVIVKSVVMNIHLVTLNRGHLAVLGVKWPFSNGRDRR